MPTATTKVGSREEIHLPPMTGPQLEILNATDRLLLIEGSPRSAKSWGIAFKIWMLAWTYPGIQIFYSRYKDESLSQLRDVWTKVGAFFPDYLHPSWTASDAAWDFANGSRVYLSSIKASELDALHSKYKGKTLAVVVIEEASEVPKDNYIGLRERLSQSRAPDGTPFDYPLQIILVTNCVDEDHWIAQEWPEGSDEPGYRRTIRASLLSNAANLGRTVVEGYERDYPAGHTLRPTVIEGRRGVTLLGKPVYGGVFVKDIHVDASVAFDPRYPLREGWDFGQEKPAVTWWQYIEHLAAIRILGAVKGSELFLEIFAPKVVEIRRRWFGELAPGDVWSWCDPTGATGNGGVMLTPVRILRDLDVPVRYEQTANQAAIRYGGIQAIAGFMCRLARDTSPAFVMHPRCIELVKEGATLRERDTDLLVRAFEVGYVWDEHAAPDTNPNIRKPKKGTRYDDLMNAFEYGVIGGRLSVPRDLEVLVASRRLARSGDRQAQAAQREQHRLRQVGSMGETLIEAERRIAKMNRAARDVDDSERYGRGRIRGRGGY